MGAQTQPLEDRLQAEFCPPLDSSLIAAIIADYFPNGETAISPSSQAEQSLRTILKELAAQAEKDENDLSEQLANVGLDIASVTDDTHSTNDYFSNDTNTTSPTEFSSASDTSSGSSSQHPFSSPLGFLQTAFPDVPTHRLRSILSSMGDIDDLDMEDVVNQICSLEHIGELEQRGIDGLSGEEDVDDYASWKTAASKKKTPPKKQKQRGTTFTFGDVRHNQRIRTAPNTPGPSVAPPDPWTQVSSLATHLSSLVPSHNASQFQSILHSPKYSTPSAAIRATLSNCSPLDESAETTMLFALFDILRESEEWPTLSQTDRDQLMADAKLALRATRGQPDAALDLINLLRELDTDSVTGGSNWTLYHSPVPSPQLTTNAAKKPKLNLKLPSGPPPIAPVSRRQYSAPVSPVTPPPSVNVWKTVAPAVKKTPAQHPLAEFIPAYNTTAPMNRQRAKTAGAGLGLSRTSGLRELGVSKDPHVARATELAEKRREALKDASRAWHSGNAKTRGGEIAWYYAEKAREYQQREYQEKLQAAKGMVDKTRQFSKNGNTIDLHGTTVKEAIQIVNEVLAEECPTPSKPLNIITGRGRHSAKGISVLAPALRSALTDQGWIIGSWYAGIVVRGKGTNV
ncbi:hypothetical protein K474DRAFT_1705938 [Panus rudis PR-1116 ss-1]|nr:hypothetical protein K474DRAFT_1705938 [Panus rudis PR-1116 ss-1]